jgi:hypothetical protein
MLIRVLNQRQQIYARNRTIAVALCLLLLVEVCVGGYTISMTSPGTLDSGPPGMNPPCVAVPPDLGWMIEFWVSRVFHETFLWRPYLVSAVVASLL